MRKSLILLCAALCFSFHLFSQSRPRVWTSKSGSTINATLHKLDDNSIYIKKTSDQKTIRVSLDQLSDPDIIYLKASPFWHQKGILYSNNLGAIIVLATQGGVSCINNDTMDTKTLSVGMKIKENYTIQTAADAKVTLLFSNGTTTEILENTDFTILEFKQEDINKNTSIQNQSKELSASSTRLKLNYGKLISNIQKLESHSAYTIQTPNGAAGIRGTDIFLSSNEDNLSFSVLDGIADFWSPTVGIVEVGDQHQFSLSDGESLSSEINDDIASIIKTSKNNSQQLKQKISIDNIIDSISETNEQSKLEEILENAEVTTMVPEIKTSRDLKDWLVGTTWNMQGKNGRPEPKLDDSQTQLHPNRKHAQKHPQHQQPTIVFINDEHLIFGKEKNCKYETKSKNKIIVSNPPKSKKVKRWVKSWEIEFSDDYLSFEATNLIVDDIITGEFKSKK